MPWLEWSKVQNDRSHAKQIAKQERERVEQEIELEKQRAEQRAEREEFRRSHLESLLEQVEVRVASASNPKDAVRSFVEGDVYTYDADAREERDRISQLQFTLGEKKSRLIEITPVFDRAWIARRNALSTGEAVARLSTRKPVAKPRRIPLVLSTVVLVCLETFLLRHPMERLALNIAPDLKSGLTVALALALGLVTLSTASLLFAARCWGEYQAAVDEADPTAVDAGGEVVGEDVPMFLPWAATITAAALQVVLFYLRFQTGSTNDTTKQGLIAASAMALLGSAIVGFLEYRYAYSKSSLLAQNSSTRGEEIVDEYFRLHREVSSEIPRLINEAKRLRLQAIERYLRDLQRVAELKGSLVLAAITDLIAETEKDIAAVPDVPFVDPPLPA